MEGLNWQTVEFPFGFGLNQKMDARAIGAPEMLVCKNARFDEFGGLQTRYSFAAAQGDIVGGGTVADVRTVVRNGDELLLFTKNSLYSWNAQQSKWVSRGTHLAVKVEEEPRFVSTGEQIDCDRAELANTIIYAWADAGNAYVAAVDKTTGSVLTGPTMLVDETRPRLVALTTKILLFTATPGPAIPNGLVVRAIDPASPAAGIASTSTLVLTTASFGNYYDVVRVPSTDTAVGACRRATTTSYEAFKVTAALAVTNSTIARTCDGPIAVSCPTTATHVQVVRTDNAGGSAVDIVGDLLLVSNLSTVFFGQAIGSSAGAVSQIAAAHRSVQNSSAYRCYAFWSDSESGIPQPAIGGGSRVHSNWVDTAGTLGTAATFVMALGVASRAFDYDGSVFVNLVFAGEALFVGAGLISSKHVQLQNTYFLYRDDGFVVSKSVYQRAGGFVVSTGHLPGVALTDGSTGYSWCGTERRVVSVGGEQSSYADRGPRDVSITFDSNEARRCVRLGRTLYITGGQILQYDGKSLVELGFHHYPYYVAGSSGTGSIETGDYGVKIYYRSDNAVGERDRSTTATVGLVHCSNPGSVVFDDASPLVVTLKDRVAVEFWRTLKSPEGDAPFYRVSGSDPSDVTGANCFVFNDAAAGVQPRFEDELADADAGDGESDPESGGALESIAPPPATIILATDTRIFLAGVAGDPDRVWYSKQRADGAVASFNDGLVANVPAPGGEITGLGWLNETLVVFRENAIYALGGDGLDNVGGGQNLVAREVPDSTGIGAVNHESIAVIDRGLIFKSSKGWYLLNRGWALEYIGGPIKDYDGETPLAVHAMESAQHHVRIVLNSRVLVLDTLVSDHNQRPTWCEWSLVDLFGAAVWRGGYVLLDSGGIRAEQVGTFATADDEYGLEASMLVKFNGQLGYARCRKVLLLGEFRSAYTVAMSMYRDHQSNAMQGKSIASAVTYGAGEPLKERFGPKYQQVMALRVQFVFAPNLVDGPTGECVKLTSLGFEVGVKRGLSKNVPAERQGIGGGG